MKQCILVLVIINYSRDYGEVMGEFCKDSGILKTLNRDEAAELDDDFSKYHDVFVYFGTPYVFCENGEGGDINILNGEEITVYENGYIHFEIEYYDGGCDLCEAIKSTLKNKERLELILLKNSVWKQDAAVLEEGLVSNF